jgi:SAM-dependent methyltransferase
VNQNSLKDTNGIIWRAEFRPCPICESGKRKKIGLRGGRFHREGKGIETSIVKCLDCDLLYTYPTLLPESNPYECESAEEYFQIHDAGKKIKQGEDLAKFAESIQGNPGKILEIGCGRGEQLIGAGKRGWEVHGIEMTPEYARIAQDAGVEIENSSVEESRSLNEKYDVILLAAILEHLYEPLDTLKRIKEALRPGGLVFIDVPNESSLTMRAGNLYMKTRRRKWVINMSPTFAPYHVVGFSPQSLRFALEKAGFRIHTLELPRWMNPVRKNGGLAKKAEYYVFETVQRVGSVLGMGDGIVCWAVRD